MHSPDIPAPMIATRGDRPPARLRRPPEGSSLRMEPLHELDVLVLATWAPQRHRSLLGRIRPEDGLA
jgi:hypothetical protein